MPKDAKRSSPIVWPAILVFLAFIFWLSQAAPQSTLKITEGAGASEKLPDAVE